MPPFKRILGFGTFDGLHEGHMAYLKQLYEMADEVYVVIARDHNVQKIKSQDTVYDEQTRLKAVQGTGLVTEVILGHDHDFYSHLKPLNPDAIGLGYDQRANLEDLKAHFPDATIKRLEAFEPEKYKSSIINKRKG